MYRHIHKGYHFIRGNKIFIKYNEPLDLSASLMSRYEYKKIFKY